MCVCVCVCAGSALAASVCKKITGRLTSAIAKQEDVSVQLEALDIMADMLCRYPSHLTTGVSLPSRPVNPLTEPDGQRSRRSYTGGPGSTCWIPVEEPDHIRSSTGGL